MRGTGAKGRDMISSIWVVQIYASYETNRSQGSRYDQFIMSGYKSTLVMRGTGAKGRDMISYIWVGTNLYYLWEEKEERDEIWSVLYEWERIYIIYERNRSKGTRYDQFYMSGHKSILFTRGTGAKGRDTISSIWVGTNLYYLREEQEQRDEIWTVLYEWVQIYASYERNRSKGTRYDQFYMSGYKSTLVMRGTGAKGRDMISSIWVGTNLR